ncbi:MAG: roadblock/LC7 domain-containing protein [Candidatus Zixiibacteriota bacterium]|jgi:predicted regulator of Ras-like GTPase activity (Roadblock/LC7/MglB family)
MAKSRADTLRDILKDLEAATPDIEGSVVVSADGLVMASALPSDVDEDRVAAMAAALLALGDRSSTELDRGDLSEVFVKGEKGYIVLMGAGREAVLGALCREDAKLGMIFLDMRRAAKDVESVV